MIIPQHNIIGQPVLGRPVHYNPVNISIEKGRMPPRQTEVDLPKSLNFIADHSGCGFWRLFWPSDQLNSRMQSVVMSICMMIGDENFYKPLKTVRIQRQATPQQLEFVKWLVQIKQTIGFNLIYEIDDVMFYDDIPEYNHFKPGFSPHEIRESSKLIMQSCDEITCTNKYIADYYASKTGNPRTTIIPNYLPKWWAGNMFDEKKVSISFDKNKKKPRVLYAGSGAHADVDGRCNGKDDFYHINEIVRKTINKYQWVFYGVFPRALKDLVDSGKIEFHQWTKLYDYPEKMASLKCQVLVAPLQDNVFNRAKSDIKITEAGAFGIVPVCQDLEPYERASYKFKSGDEMIDQIDAALKHKDTFMKSIRKNRIETEKLFLENPENIGKWEELYNHNSYRHPERKFLNEFNKNFS